jgi:ATP-dependent RNA helicase HelY
VLAEAPDLTPGDFVRSVKQLIDLLDQIANATPDAPAGPDRAAGPDADAVPGAVTGPGTPGEPEVSVDPERSRGLAMTARAAIDAMRRGVIAYSAVAD